MIANSFENNIFPPYLKKVTLKLKMKMKMKMRIMIKMMMITIMNFTLQKKHQEILRLIKKMKNLLHKEEIKEDKD